MKTLFILTYCILTSTKITNADFIEFKRVECPTYDAALVEYNKVMNGAYVINPDIKEVQVKDTLLAKDTAKRADTIINDNLKDE